MFRNSGGTECKRAGESGLQRGIRSYLPRRRRDITLKPYYLKLRQYIREVFLTHPVPDLIGRKVREGCLNRPRMPLVFWLHLNGLKLGDACEGRGGSRINNLFSGVEWNAESSIKLHGGDLWE